MAKNPFQTKFTVPQIENAWHMFVMTAAASFAVDDAAWQKQKRTEAICCPNPTIGGDLFLGSLPPGPMKYVFEDLSHIVGNPDYNGRNIRLRMSACAIQDSLERVVNTLEKCSVHQCSNVLREARIMRNYCAHNGNLNSRQLSDRNRVYLETYGLTVIGCKPIDPLKFRPYTEEPLYFKDKESALIIAVKKILLALDDLCDTHIRICSVGKTDG